ncbi:MAG: PCRF domain-containing protein, partial [Deltaproteobacteria bacterium]|nr:PCRF domain-containing protein [Deltaproteobacteria bacterium]
MHEQLKGVENRFLELEKLLSDPSVLQDREKYQNYSREHSDLSKVVAVLRTYEQTRQELDDSRELLKDSDPDIKEMARTELETLKSRKSRLED